MSLQFIALGALAEPEVPVPEPMWLFTRACDPRLRGHNTLPLLSSVGTGTHIAYTHTAQIHNYF